MHNIKRIVFFCLIQLFWLSNYVFGQQKLVSSKVVFTIENAGIEVNGSFTGLTGNFRFNSDNYLGSTMEAIIPVSTIKTGNSMRDGHLKKKEYFDVEQYSEIKIKSKFFGKQGDQFKGYFLLSIKGVTKEVIVPFTMIEKGQVMLLNGTFELNRRDYNVGGKSLLMSDKVKIQVSLELLR